MMDKSTNGEDERLHEAELLHRVWGDLLNAGADRSGAERHYRQAIVVAERQREAFTVAGLDQPRPAPARLVPRHSDFDSLAVSG
jgi:predicted RNA polymerase sigma factor